MRQPRPSPRAASPGPSPGRRPGCRPRPSRRPATGAPAPAARTGPGDRPGPRRSPGGRGRVALAFTTLRWDDGPKVQPGRRHAGDVAGHMVPPGDAAVLPGRRALHAGALDRAHAGGAPTATRPPEWTFVTSRYPAGWSSRCSRCSAWPPSRARRRRSADRRVPRHRVDDHAAVVLAVYLVLVTVAPIARRPTSVRAVVPCSAAVVALVDRALCCPPAETSACCPRWRSTS